MDSGVAILKPGWWSVSSRLEFKLSPDSLSRRPGYASDRETGQRPAIDITILAGYLNQAIRIKPGDAELYERRAEFQQMKEYELSVQALGNGRDVDDDFGTVENSSE